MNHMLDDSAGKVTLATLFADMSGHTNKMSSLSVSCLACHSLEFPDSTARTKKWHRHTFRMRLMSTLIESVFE